MVKTAQDGEGDDAPRARVYPLHLRRSYRDRLAEPLVWPGAVAVPAIRAEDAPQVGLAADEEVVQALPPHAAEEALAGGVRPRGADGRAQHADPARGGEMVEARSVLGVIIADEQARPLVERRGLAPLLGDPGVGGVARHAHLDHPARPECDDEEGVERAEEQVGDREEVAGPDLRGVVA